MRQVESSAQALNNKAREPVAVHFDFSLCITYYWIGNTVADLMLTILELEKIKQ